MNEMQVFNNAEFGEVRMLEENGTVLFCGSDVARALGYGEPHKAVARHCKAGDGMKRPVIDSMGRTQSAVFIPEGDVYRLITHSKLPSAERFERWVFDEVLPSIRRHGVYMTPEVLEQVFLSPDTIIRIATALKDEQEKRKALEIANSALIVDKQIMQPKADYFDELVDRNLNTGIRETAKEYGIGQKSLVGFLMENKYIYRDKKGKLQPYAAALSDGLFVVKECFNEKTNWAGTQLLITPKGRETFRLLCAGA